MVPNLVERLKAIQAGTKLTLILKDIFGKPFDYKVAHTGQVRHHGYFTRGGAWALYKSEGDIECFELLVRMGRDDFIHVVTEIDGNMYDINGEFDPNNNPALLLLAPIRG